MSAALRLRSHWTACWKDADRIARDCKSDLVLGIMTVRSCYGALFLMLVLVGFSNQAVALKAKQVAAGTEHACALYDNGSVFCWGNERSTGQASSTKTAKRIPNLNNAVTIDSGQAGSCAVDTAGDVWCWGADLQGTVEREMSGSGSGAIWVSKPVKVKGLPPVKLVSVGYFHICALSKSSDVYCWGYNPAGELGDGTSQHSHKPKKVKSLSDIVSIGTGINNSCAANKAGNVYCWGTDNQANPSKPFVFSSKKPVRIRGVKRAKKADNGRNNFCTMQHDNKVICWGSFGYFTSKQRRSGVIKADIIPDITDMDVGLFLFCVIKRENGSVVCDGQEASIIIKNQGVRELSNAVQISIGLAFGCAILQAGEVVCWRDQGAPISEVFVEFAKAGKVPGLPE